MPGRTQSSPEATEQLNLDTLLLEYSITENGFLPGRQPLKRLPDPYYASWEAILDDLPSLIREKKIRRAVESLEVLSTTRLRTEEEWRRAYVVLSFLSHAYIWGGDQASQVLPPAISAPLLRVSKCLSLPPVATYAALNLWNFTCDGCDFRDLDKLKALHTFSGTEDESWFYSVSVAMEAQGAYIIPIMVRALDAIRHREYSTVTRALYELTTCIRKLGELLDRMDEKCDPMVFYNRIRPYLAGSKNMAAAGLPNGVLYQDGDGVLSWKQLRGGSNGQSSLIQFFDIVLGVRHTSSGASARPGPNIPTTADKEAPSFHQEVRSYMPPRHKAFLDHVSSTKSLKESLDDLAIDPAKSDEQRELWESFQIATKALGDFRNRHLQIVTRYIIVPSRKQTQAQAVNLATTSSQANRGPGSGELTGTGGTALIPFLKQTRDETYSAGIRSQ
ncbi:indoleamine 2,3-dioxygenase [Hypomontagnella submonticulosa]|nr:indoleamine 2,3-dioxygenase [Hypomontagnella submonticulosa]